MPWNLTSENLGFLFPLTWISRGWNTPLSTWWKPDLTPPALILLEKIYGQNRHLCLTSLLHKHQSHQHHYYHHPDMFCRISDSIMHWNIYRTVVILTQGIFFIIRTNNTLWDSWTNEIYNNISYFIRTQANSHVKEVCSVIYSVVFIYTNENKMYIYKSIYNYKYLVNRWSNWCMNQLGRVSYR